jgi:hypothetical protein
MTKDQSRVTPADLTRRWGVRPVDIRRMLRSLYGTLKRQDPGPRWHFTPAEVARVTMAKRRKCSHEDAILSGRLPRPRVRLDEGR